MVLIFCLIVRWRILSWECVLGKYAFYMSMYKIKSMNWKYQNKIDFSFPSLEEASTLDQINMTKYWLEHDWKFFTPTNVNIGTWPKNSQLQTLPLDFSFPSLEEASTLDRINMTKYWWEHDWKFFTPTNINIGYDQKI